jgi:hypothetical protein
MAGVVDIAQVCRRRVLNIGLHVYGCRNVPRFFFSRKMGLLELRTSHTADKNGGELAFEGLSRCHGIMAEDTYDSYYR